MQQNTTVQARISPTLKAEAEDLFESMGMSIPDAIRFLLQQCVNAGGFPFKPKAKIPNDETLAAMREIEEGGGYIAHSNEEFYKDLGI
jgi:DNA-damage-inducible protein J